jgi:hypothetical protein
MLRVDAGITPRGEEILELGLRRGDCRGRRRGLRRGSTDGAARDQERRDDDAENGPVLHASLRP